MKTIVIVAEGPRDFELIAAVIDTITRSGCTYKKHLDMKKKVCYTEEKSDDLTAG